MSPPLYYDSLHYVPTGGVILAKQNDFRNGMDVKTGVRGNKSFSQYVCFSRE